MKDGLWLDMRWWHRLPVWVRTEVNEWIERNLEEQWVTGLGLLDESGRRLRIEHLRRDGEGEFVLTPERDDVERDRITVTTEEPFPVHLIPEGRR